MECSATFMQRAADRADSPQDYLRLMGLHHALAGEVWSKEDRSFWFDEPLFHRPTPPPVVPTPAPVSDPPERRRRGRRTSPFRADRPRMQRARRR